MKHSALITGAAGFIGSHLVDRLVAGGWNVTALDNLSIGRRTNIVQLNGCARFTLVVGDVADRDLVVQVARDARAEVIFHLAASNYIPLCDAEPFDAMRTNVLGTQAVADAALAAGVTRIVFTSTSDVYAPKDAPLVEDDHLDPYTTYGTSKLLAERLLRLAASKQSQLSVAVARLFNVYGPRETNPHVLPEIVEQLKHLDEAPMRLGNLWPRRDFIFVEDVADALIQLVETPGTFDTFNVGSGRATSIGQVVAVFGELLQRNLDVVTDADRARPIERSCLHADITKITRSTTWRPRWTLRDGLMHWLAAEELMAGYSLL